MNSCQEGITANILVIMDDPGLGPYLMRLRERRGWTITDAAAHVGMSKSHLSQLESGKIGLPNAALRRRLAATYGVRHADILVAAGELTAEECGPQLVPSYGDDRLRSLVEHWQEMTEKEREFVMLVLDGSLRRQADAANPARIATG